MPTKNAFFKNGKTNKDFNEEFKEDQDLYLATKDKKYLTKMYELSRIYLRSYILEYVKKRELFLDIDCISTKAHDGATWIIERYLNNPDFKIDRFTAYAHFGFLKAMFQNKEKEMQEKELINKDPKDYINMEIYGADIITDQEENTGPEN